MLSCPYCHEAISDLLIEMHFVKNSFDMGANVQLFVCVNVGYLKRDEMVS